MPTITLSAQAVAVLRFEIRGWKAKDPASRLPAYRELAEAGIMEVVPGSGVEYRFTREGLDHGEAILEQETERIERERYEPPDAIRLSDAARELWRRANHRGLAEEVAEAPERIVHAGTIPRFATDGKPPTGGQGEFA